MIMSKKNYLLKPDEPLLRKCLKHIQSLPNLEVKLNQTQDLLDSSSVDGLLTIRSSIKSADYAYTIQPDVTANTVKLVIRYFKLLKEKFKNKLILITRYLSDTTIEQLLNENIEFIDSLGNIYIDSSAAYIFVRGKHRLNVKPLSHKQITPISFKIIYSLLKNPEILTLPLQELADNTGTTLSSITNTLENLYKLGYIMRQPRGGYRIANYIKLFERWEIGYVETLRPKLLIETFTYTKENKFSEFAENIINLASANNILIGGELGAALTTSYLLPQSATLHVTGNHHLIAAKLQLKPDAKGAITFLTQFGKQNYGASIQGACVADPLLIHAELMTESDDRLEETAELIFTKYIKDKYQNA
ncbi:hypothetical protein NIES4071_91220 [Calothrix sp. NIES-4071]|nr:hypothetical protein NIES4071_91220 [Calothrix sp. NIES-4071]BAZ63389.1 hypothetical protein NIES4105_91150 [Calothrix sp. NIES-4105]